MVHSLLSSFKLPPLHDSELRYFDEYLQRQYCYLNRPRSHSEFWRLAGNARLALLYYRSSNRVPPLAKDSRCSAAISLDSNPHLVSWTQQCIINLIYIIIIISNERSLPALHEAVLPREEHQQHPCGLHPQISQHPDWTSLEGSAYKGGGGHCCLKDS
jgi:hypothetical protein